VKFRPYEVSPDEIESLVLSEVSGEQVIVLELQDTKPELSGVGNVDVIVASEKSIRGKGPTRMGRCWKVFRS
jgi:hypothetical protein